MTTDDAWPTTSMDDEPPMMTKTAARGKKDLFLFCFRSFAFGLDRDVETVQICFIG